MTSESKLETDGLLTAGSHEFYETMPLNSENIIIEGLTNNSEFVIAGIQLSKSLNSAPLETGQESDGQLNSLTSSTADKMHSESKHTSAEDIFDSEDQCQIEERMDLNKSNAAFNASREESKQSEDTEDSLALNILKSQSNMTEVESNSKELFEEKLMDQVGISSSAEELETNKEAATENELLTEINCASSQKPSEDCTRDDLDKIVVGRSFEYSEAIPKIVVCNTETTGSNSNVIVKSDEKFGDMIGVNADELKQQKLEETGNLEQFEIATNDKMIINDATEGVDNGIEMFKKELDEFLKQYIDDIIQNVAQSSDGKFRTYEISNEVVENVEIAKTDEKQHAIFTPKYFAEFQTELPEIRFSKLEYDETCQRKVEKPLGKELSESSDINNVRNFQEINDINIPPEGAEKGDTEELSGYQGESDETFQRYVANSHSFMLTTEANISVGNTRSCPKQESESSKDLLEFQTIHLAACIISGLTVDGKPILCSVSESSESSMNQCIGSFPQDSDTAEFMNDKLSLINDRNGNPEWNTYQMQHILPSDEFNESNCCAADVNANISTIQETSRMLSMKHEVLSNFIFIYLFVYLFYLFFDNFKVEFV
uniref:Uncharacterized protein n=1 Tax=Setaria digitata TaxID=48799 RepID=A0A915PHF9_9BILA